MFIMILICNNGHMIKFSLDGMIDVIINVPNKLKKDLHIELYLKEVWSIKTKVLIKCILGHISGGKWCPFFHKDENRFKQRQDADIMKTKLAIDNNYYLIRIAHIDMDYIEVINSYIPSSDKLYKR